MITVSTGVCLCYRVISQSSACTPQPKLPSLLFSIPSPPPLPHLESPMGGEGPPFLVFPLLSLSPSFPLEVDYLSTARSLGSAV